MSALRFTAALVLAVVVWIGGAALFIGWQTRGLGAAASAVIEDWQAGDYESLFLERSAPIFRNTTNEAELAHLAAMLRLEKSNGSRVGRGYSGDLGWVHARFGSPGADIELQFERHAGRWLLRSVTSPVMATGLDDLRRQVPEALITTACHELMRLFAIGANQGSLDLVQQEFAQVVRHEVTPRRLHDSFGSFLGMDLLALVNMQPVIDRITAPPLEKLELEVDGHYPTEPPLIFHLRWLREGAALRLSALEVSFDDSK